MNYEKGAREEHRDRGKALQLFKCDFLERERQFYECNNCSCTWYYDKVFAHYERLFWGASGASLPKQNPSFGCEINTTRGNRYIDMRAQKVRVRVLACKE